MLPALAAPVSLMAPTATLALGAKTELRRRQPGDRDSDGVGDEAAYDWELAGLAALALDFRRTRLVLSYKPDFAYVNFVDLHEGATDLLHVFALDNEWRWRHTRLTLSEGVAFGTRTSSAMSLAPKADPVTGGVVLQALPVSTSLHYFSNNGTAGIDHALSRRSSVGLSVGYTLSGGTDAPSRRALPFAVGEHAVAQWQYPLTRHDTGVSELSGETVRTDAGPTTPQTRTSVVGVAEHWRRDWSEDTRTELVLGGRYAVESFPIAAAFGYPMGSASISQRVHTGPENAVLLADANAGFDVVIDRLTGLADRRWLVNLGAAWSLDRTTLRASAGHSASLFRDDPNALVVTYGEASVAYRVLDPLIVDAGFRFVDQHYEAPRAPAAASIITGLQWTTFIGVAFAAPPVVLAGGASAAGKLDEESSGGAQGTMESKPAGPGSRLENPRSTSRTGESP